MNAGSPKETKSKVTAFEAEVICCQTGVVMKTALTLCLETWVCQGIPLRLVRTENDHPPITQISGTGTGSGSALRAILSDLTKVIRFLHRPPPHSENLQLTGLPGTGSISDWATTSGDYFGREGTAAGDGRYGSGFNWPLKVGGSVSCWRRK